MTDSAPSTPVEDELPPASQMNSLAIGETPTDAAQDSAAKKKKKKKKSKKKAGATATGESDQHAGVVPAKKAAAPAPPPPVRSGGQAPAGFISRLKHTRYISCYHVSGPWLQLPSELLQTLLLVNSGPAPGTPSDAVAPGFAPRRRLRAADEKLSEEEQLTVADYESQMPPPVDPRCFRTVVAVRHLVEEASDLAVRATIGVGSSTTHDVGRPQLGMSSTRQHRLRALAVSKLARAYGLDEIATSVVVMQGSSALEDVADKVLRVEPDNPDARYVGHFHEKILGRTYATSTTTKVFDLLIDETPDRLDYIRSKGICLSQKQEYVSAIKTFTHGLALAKAARKARRQQADAHGKGSRKKSSRGPASPNGTDGATPEAADPGAQPPDVGADEATPEEDFQRQFLFNRGMAYLHCAHALLEDTVLTELEGKDIPPGGLSSETGELPLSAFGLDLDPIQALYDVDGRPEKAKLYRERLERNGLRERLTMLLRRASRDHERFLSSFPIWEAPPASIFEEERKSHPYRPHDHTLAFRGRRLCHHRALSGRSRYGDPRVQTPTEPALLTSYHPLLIESHFSVLLCHLLLGDFSSLMPLHYRAARLMDYLESYPAWLISRSLCQTEYVEVFERLATTWWEEQDEATRSALPKESEADVALRGDLQSLRHLVAFFTAEYDQILNNVASEAERKVRETFQKGKASAKALPDRSAPVSSRAKAPLALEGPQDAKGSSRPTTAKSEIVLAWLRAIVITDLETADGEGKGKGKASSVQEEVVSESRKGEANGHGAQGSSGVPEDSD